MHVRTPLALLGIAGLLAVPVAAAGGSGAVVASAEGSSHWTIPLPNAFDVEVWNRTLSLNTRRYADGSITGRLPVTASWRRR